MEGKSSSAVDVLKSIFSFDIVGRVFFLAAIAGSVAIGLGLYHWIQEPIFRPLPYYVTDKNLQSIVQELDKSNINYRVNDYDHTISVPVDEVKKAKLSLSLAGIQKDDSFNFSYLNDQSQLGGSQFLENARYIRALEADLARTIGGIQGVNAAKVHLAIPQHNIFADEKSKPSASVVVHFTPGYENDKEKIRAISQLIAASVPELEPNNVVITNQYGHYLSASNTQESLLNQQQLDYQNNMQNYYEKKIRALITPMVGINKTSISVNVALDFTQQEQSKEEFDPNQTTLRSEQSVNESNSAPSTGGVPGSLSNQPPAATPPAAGAQQPAAGAQQPSAVSSGQSRSESIKNYEVTKSLRYVKTSSPQIKAISVAIIVDDEAVLDPKTKKMISRPVPKVKLDNLTNLVKSTIGFSQSRGDSVTVINSGFLPEKIEVEEKIPLWEEPWFWEWAKQIAGILVGFIFLFIVYKKFISNFKPKARAGLPAAAGSLNHGDVVTPEMMQLKEEQIKILRELVAKDPNKVANIIKKWIAT